ncbi:MAG: tRNA 2-thiouridine(34) synthase MnmA [Bacteroidales bacterium]
MKRVVVGLSGGVDSSVAAYVLKEQGFDVVGLFMKNWHDTTGVLHGDCPFDDDYNFAQMVARKLKIPFEMVDLSKQYRKRVVDYMFDEYSRGRTPNPDVLCNREIKFDEFMKAALALNADYVATGHYCRKDTVEINGKTTFRLLAGTDNNKDQSYFLCQLNQKQLEKALFPIGDIEKPEVRKIAAELGLASAQRKDSQGICFVGKVDLPIFLQQKLQAKKGDIIEIPKDFNAYNQSVNLSELKEVSSQYAYSAMPGKKVGTHNGAHFYTIGQRKGLNVGGTPEPLFVIAIDVDENIVYVGQGKNHPGLFRSGLLIPADEIHWVRPDLLMKVGETKEYLVRIRYRQPLQKAKLFMKADGMYIVFEQPQRGIAAGQFAAWYDNDELVGSGVIS